MDLSQFKVTRVHCVACLFLNQRYRLLKACEIQSIIEEFAPPRFAASWDNVGWQVGDPSQSVKGILLTLDFTPEVLEEAVHRQANLIISHHPFLFRPFNKIDLSSFQGKLIAGLIKNGVSLYSAHTNLDVSPEGVNYALANRFGLKDIQPLRLLDEAAETHKGDPTEILPMVNRLGQFGWGAIGELETALMLEDLVELAGERLGHPVIRVVKGKSSLYRRIAVCGGSGSDFITDAALKAEAFVTSDVRYHQAQDCERLGLTLIDVPHYNTERPVLDVLARLLQSSTSIPIHVSQVVTSPFVDETLEN